MIFTVTIKEVVERIVELEVEAPSQTVAGTRALEMYEDAPEIATILSETSFIKPEELIINVSD